MSYPCAGSFHVRDRVQQHDCYYNTANNAYSPCNDAFCPRRYDDVTSGLAHISSQHSPYEAIPPPASTATAPIAAAQASGSATSSQASGTVGAMATPLNQDTKTYIDQAFRELANVLRTACGSAAQPSGPQPKLKEPDVFDGNKARYRAWKQQVQQYVGGLDKDRALTTIMSFVRGERIERWRQAFSNTWFHDRRWLFHDEASFWLELDRVHVDPNLAKTAQIRLEHLKMGNMPAAQFFQEFEELVSEAGFLTSDIHVLDVLQRNTRYQIVERIYASGEEPVDYDDWKKRISNMDTLWRRGQIILGKQGISQSYDSPLHSTTLPSYKPTAPTSVPAPQASLPTTQRTSTGVLYGGRGQPMDLDRACLKCGKKKSEAGPCQSTWHVGNRDAAQHRVRRAWEDSDARAEFLESIRLFAAEDPDDFAEQGFGFGST